MMQQKYVESGVKMIVCLQRYYPDLLNPNKLQESLNWFEF